MTIYHASAAVSTASTAWAPHHALTVAIVLVVAHIGAATCLARVPCLARATTSPIHGDARGTTRMLAFASWFVGVAVVIVLAHAAAGTFPGGAASGTCGTGAQELILLSLSLLLSLPLSLILSLSLSEPSALP